MDVFEVCVHKLFFEAEIIISRVLGAQNAKCHNLSLCLNFDSLKISFPHRLFNKHDTYGKE